MTSVCSDPYDTGTPKYKTAQAIYDGLCELTQSEEMGILGEMFQDVSYDGQEYYYTDKGCALKAKFEEQSDYGRKMWLMDLAVFQIDNDEIHSTVYDALWDSDLAKRLDFKKLFITHMLHGDSSHYGEIAEECADELNELGCFGHYQMLGAFERVMIQRRQGATSLTHAEYVELCANYSEFCRALYNKAKNLRLPQETQMVAQCRALLTSYDDFILGLRMNQTLYEEQERQYRAKAAQLQAAYEEKVRQLYAIAQEIGVVLDGTQIVKLLGETVLNDNNYPENPEEELQ